MTHSRHALFLLFTTSLLFSTSCGPSAIKEDVDGGSSGADTSPPLTTATPGGGLYSEGQNVTLSANEPATVYYTTDGVIPTIGGLTTLSGPSPVTNIDTSTGVGGADFRLRFFSVDENDQVESLKQAVYSYDLTPPVVGIQFEFAQVFGFLDPIPFGFTTDEPGFYWFELGGDGTQGSGTLIAQGPAPTGQLNQFEIPTWSLEMNHSNPGLLAYLHVQNLAGGYTSIDVRIKTKDESSAPLAGNTAGIELTPDESYGFLLRPDEGEVWKFVANSSVGTFLSLSALIPVGADLRSMRVTADSSKLYVTSSAGVYEVDVATESLSASFGLPGGIGCSGIALLAGSNEAVLAGDDGMFYIMDLSSGSVPALPFEELAMDSAEIYQSNDGLQAAIVWSGATDFGVKILDTDPGSFGYLNAVTDVISGPVPPLIPQFTFNTLGTVGYTGDSTGRLTNVLLGTNPPVVGSSGANSNVNGLRISPAGQALILTENPLPGLFVGNPLTLQITHLYDTGGTGSGPTSRDVRFSNAMGMIILIRNNGLPSAELLALPL